ncbi:MAG: YceI family protein [Proteobacteria bacterium]|nr:YceI family protein [Pseudomonadota bacterium]
MKTLLAVAVAALISLPASATTWVVVPEKSRLGFNVTWSGQPFVATFKAWKAEIAFDPADLAHSRAVVLIDLASETSDSADNDDGLKSPEGLSVDRFPTAKFETTGFTARGGNAYIANGRLSLHGLTRDVTLPFTLTVSGRTAHMVGRTTVSRLDFGLGTSGEWAGETPIAHTVTITVDLTATR